MIACKLTDEMILKRAEWTKEIHEVNPNDLGKSHIVVVVDWMYEEAHIGLQLVSLLDGWNFFGYIYKACIGIIKNLYTSWSVNIV